MIKAKQETVEVPVTTITKQEVVTIEMSVEMAQFLYDVTGLIAGHPVDSRRKLAHDLRVALGNLKGVDPTYKDKYGSIAYTAADITGGITFSTISK